MTIIAIIPTHNRPGKLRRALDSVSAQTHEPDHLIIVHESGDESPQSLSENRFHITVNLRTKSLSGAINHAIDEIILHRHAWGIAAEDTWLALLDDDDWWEPSYIEKCGELAESGVQQVVSGLIRYDSAKPDGFPLSIPDNLDVSSFLVENPHIQGSNLFVRLDTFLEAGGFDESLYSCTDRDVCIRLFERPEHQWARLDEHLVHHDARDSGRISDPGSPRKIMGLRKFATKHQFRMDDDTWGDFLRVAEERFGFKIGSGLQFNAEGEGRSGNIGTFESRGPLESDERFELTIAATIGESRLVNSFAESVMEISSHWPWKVRLVICLHRLSSEDIDSMLIPLRESGIEVITHEESYGFRLADKGGLGPWFVTEENRHGASWGRCVLHRAALDSVLEDRRPAIWIVDDDMSLNKGCWGECESGPMSSVDSLFAAISFMNRQGIDVGVGHVVGDPPLPSIFTQRTQLLDMHYQEMMRENPERNRIGWRDLDFRDVHHDLATHRWDHLEFPLNGQEGVGNLDEAIDGIFSGKAVTREVHGDWSKRNYSDPIYRGGNTIILNPNALKEWPNVAPNCGGIQFRRGDSIWAMWAQRIWGPRVGKEKFSVGWIPFAIPQNRISEPQVSLTCEHIRGDILGSMFLRELQSLFTVDEIEKNRGIIESSNWFNGLEERTILASMRREARLISNIFRINQLAKLMGKESSRTSKIEDFWSSTFPQSVSTDLEEFCSNFVKNVVKFRSLQPKFRPGHRVEGAWQYYLDFGGSETALVGGHGSEGVVFKEGSRATKVFHEGVSLTEENMAILTELSTEKKQIKCLPKNLKIGQFPYRTILSHDWVEGEHPTRQISSRPWLELLRECRDNEIVFWNLKPQNVILTKEGDLVNIDLGRDLKPFTENDWSSMVRKGYLCWKYWDREDLRYLLSRSIRDTNPATFPELEGIDWFYSSIEILDKSELHDPWLLDIISRHPPGKLLDWGCGNGRLTGAIANLGHTIDAFDPETGFKQRVDSSIGVSWIDGSESISNSTYDIALASLVLCVIEDNREASSTLATLRRGLKSDGIALVTVCHPRYITTRCSTTTVRPAVEVGSGLVSYEKRVRSTGRYRTEHTRSIELIEELANEAGLEIVGTYDSPGFDVDKSEPISEYLALELAPLAITIETPEVNR